MKTEEALMTERVGEQVGCWFVGHLHDIEDARDRRDERLAEVQQACDDIAEATETVERMQAHLESLPAKLTAAQLAGDDDEVAKLKRHFTHAHDIIAENESKRQEAQSVLNRCRPNALRDTTAAEAVEGVYAEASREAHKCQKELEATRKAWDKTWDKAMGEFKEQANRLRK